MKRAAFAGFLLPLLLSFTGAQSNLPDASLANKAVRLAHEFIIVDGHVDIPYRLKNRYEDISVRTPGGDFDYVRAREGGLDAPFMSIYIPSDRENNGAKALADTLIDMVYEFQRKWPDKFAVATSVDDVRRNFAKGLISLPMGMENGAPLEGRLENLKYFHERGIRYITLTHGRDNHISDSSYDTTRTWKGLSPFGKMVVAEMNRLGIMVDVSHISDDAFWQVIKLTRAPVIASHSSCRAFTPGFERNMSDDMIKALAKNGGVIMINYGSSFLSKEFQEKEDIVRSQVRRYMRENKLSFGDPAVEAYFAKMKQEHGLENADVSIVADHIDHVVKLVGIDHVGLGSDFDGVGPTLPIGLEDASKIPNLIHILLERGYSDEDIRKICGENALRVWSKVEEVSKKLMGMK
ncbi:MAG: membrane dipeptidase [Ignavibacterium sp.]